MYKGQGGDDAVRPEFAALPTEPDEESRNIGNLHRYLIGLRRRNPWLNRAQTTALRLENSCYVYETRCGDDALIVALNLADTARREPLLHDVDFSTTVAAPAPFSPLLPSHTLLRPLRYHVQLGVSLLDARLSDGDTALLKGVAVGTFGARGPGMAQLETTAGRWRQVLLCAPQSACSAVWLGGEHRIRKLSCPHPVPATDRLAQGNCLLPRRERPTQ